MSVTRLVLVYSIFLISSTLGPPPLEEELESNDHSLPRRQVVSTRVVPPVDAVLVSDDPIIAPRRRPVDAVLVSDDPVLAPRRRVVTRVVPERDKESRVHVTHEVHHVVHNKKTRRHRRRRIRPIVVADHHDHGHGHDGSYVAVSGTPGRGAVHVVENVPALTRGNVINGVRVRYRPNKRVVQVVGNNRGVVQVVPEQEVVQVVGRRAPPPVAHPSTRVVGGAREVVVAAPPRDTQVVVDRRSNTPQVVVQPVAVPYPTTGGQGAFLPNQQTPGTSPVLTGDRLPLPECSYINTDFPGDDIILSEDGSLGINAGSARACKARCKLEATCLFWTYKEGFNRDLDTRDCFLKEGTPGLPVPRDAVPRIGFVSGTPDNNCICIQSEDEADEVCPLQDLPGGGVYPWKSTEEEIVNRPNVNVLEQGLNSNGIYGDPRFFGLAGVGGNTVNTGIFRNTGVIGNTGVFGNTNVLSNTGGFGVNNRLDPKFAQRDPFFPPVAAPNSRESIEASVRNLRNQLDILSTKLGGQSSPREL